MGGAEQSAVLTTDLWHFMEESVSVWMGHIAGDLASSERRSLWDRENSRCPFMYQILLPLPNIDLTSDFSVCHIACVKPSRKGGPGVNAEGAACIRCLPCCMWSARAETYLSTETKAELSVHVCLYLLRKHLKIFFIRSFP